MVLRRRHGSVLLLALACGSEPTTGHAWLPTAAGDDTGDADDGGPNDDDAGDDDDHGDASDADPSAGSETASPLMDVGPPPTPLEALCDDLQTRPPPVFDEATLGQWWEGFATEYVDRDRGSSSNIAAGQFLRDELLALGYAVEILELPSSSGTVRVVEAIKLGTEEPDTHVGLAAHYDVIAQTSAGAYDNASGVAVQLQICRLLADVPTRKSVACLFFDAEELGRVGSEAYVAATSRHFDQVFGYDMVGLNYPAMPWKLYASLGVDDPLVAPHSELVGAALFECAGLPEEGFELLPYYDKRSDEASFMAVGVPILRFAGGREASDYNGYHNSWDTVENVIDVAGSRVDFEAGMAMAVAASYFAILAFDRYDPTAVPWD